MPNGKKRGGGSAGGTLGGTAGPPSSGVEGTDEGTVGHVVELVVKTFDEKPEDVVKNIARMAAPLRGGESDPTRETILSYARQPTTILVKGKTVTRRNRLTPLHHKFAHLVLNYLEGRRRVEDRIERIEISPDIRESTPWQRARKICKTVLEEERDRRFERPLGNDPGLQSEIESIAGVYAICRRESSDGKYHQELMVLRNSGTKKVPRCHCTMVTEKTVARGEWMLVGNIVYCSVSGFREDNSHEVGSLYLSHAAGRDILSGFLAGLGTEPRDPVAMPLAATKIEASPSVLAIGDLGDEVILHEFRKYKVDLSSIMDQLRKILEDDGMEPVLFLAGNCTPYLRREFNGGKDLVHPRFLEFAKATIR